MACRLTENFKTDTSDPGGKVLADDAFRLFKADVPVVLADVGLGGRGENRFGQFFSQP